MSIHKIPALIHQIYGVVSELERLFPGRKFTPDGIMVGSIGEVLAAYYYNMKLLPQNNADHDCLSSEGINVQVKTTQRSSIDIRKMPDHLLVLRLEANGSCKEYFNGPGKLVWDNIIKGRPLPKVGFYSISLTRLSKLQKSVPGDARIVRVKA